MFVGRPILIGVPLAPDFKMDSRITTLLEGWDRKEDREVYYPATPAAELGRDKIVQYANYRFPRPSHILFIDYDVLPRKSTLDKLLAADKDIVAGVYPSVKGGNIKWCLSREDPYKRLPIEELPHNMFKTEYVGCGIMLVKMEVFDNLEWPYWRNEFKPGIKSFGEDLYFCKKAREAGYDIWVDPKIKCCHFRLVDLLSVARQLEKLSKKDKL